MPIADEGDAERSLPLFAGNTENVVAVSLQVASALEAAHRQKRKAPETSSFQGKAWTFGFLTLASVM